MKNLLFLFAALCMLISPHFIFGQKVPTSLITPFERDSSQTATHTEGVAYYQKLAQAFPTKIKLSTFGSSDGGTPLHIAVISANQTFTPESVRKAGKLVLFINNAIHPGEPEGVDATMMFVRDLLTNAKNDAFLKQNIGNGDNFLVGSDGGVWRVNWLNTTTQTLGLGYTTFQFYAGNYGATGKTAIGGLQDNGTRRGQGASLFTVFGGDGAYSHISQQNPDKAYYATQNGATYRTSTFTTGGGTTTITPTAAIAEGVDFINQFEMNYADDQQLYYRTSKALWRTTNSGITWTRLLNTGVNLTSIQAVGVENKENPTVYVGGANNFYRFDSAATLDPAVKDYVFLRGTVPTAVKADAWGTISFHPSLSSTLLVGLTTTSPSPRAWRINNGNTAAPEWVSISGDLPANLPVYQVQAHPDKPDSVYFAATAFGLYCSVNGGKNWTKETRIPNVPIFEMKLRANDRSLFLFTHGRGIFYLTLKDYLTRTRQVREKIAIKIYPNPTSDFLNIESPTPSV